MKNMAVKKLYTNKKTGEKMGKKICVITGGGSGMGLEAARFMTPDHTLILSGRTVAKLEKAGTSLKEMGYEVHLCACDVSNRKSVQELADYAANIGTITNVINAAGVSPAMADQETILRINALGTVYVNEEFSRCMQTGSVILDVSSNSAYSLPVFFRNLRAYKLADTDETKFIKKMLTLSNLPKEQYKRSGFAYALSKTFVVWYAQKCAYQYGEKGIRVASLSPGLIATEMGDIEKENGKEMIEKAAERRMGTPQELGFAIAAAADERNGYLAGVDILVDGGAINRK